MSKGTALILHVNEDFHSEKRKMLGRTVALIRAINLANLDSVVLEHSLVLSPVSRKETACGRRVTNQEIQGINHAFSGRLSAQYLRSRREYGRDPPCRLTLTEIAASSSAVALSHSEARTGQPCSAITER